MDAAISRIRSASWYPASNSPVLSPGLSMLATIDRTGGSSDIIEESSVARASALQQPTYDALRVWRARLWGCNTSSSTMVSFPYPERVRLARTGDPSAPAPIAVTRGSAIDSLSPLDRRALSFVRTSLTFNNVSLVSDPKAPISVPCHWTPRRVPTNPTLSCARKALTSTDSTGPLSRRLFGSRTTITNPESTEGGRRVSVLKWPKGAPLNLG